MTTIRALDDLEGAPHANAFPDAEPKTVRLALDEGEAVPAHDHPDREIVLYLVEGRIELEVGGEIHQVTGGEVVRFDGDQDISPRATADSTALIVLAPRADE